MIITEQNFRYKISRTLVQQAMLVGDLVKNEQSGCIGDWSLVSAFKTLIEALQYCIKIGDYASIQALSAYNKLCSCTGLGYVGPVIIDPNAQVPDGFPITGDSPLDGLQPIDIYWNDFTDDGAIDGGLGRTTYLNPDFKGINPFMQLESTTLLTVGVDYNLLPAGGFVLRANGNLPALYEGQKIRVYNYQTA